MRLMAASAFARASTGSFVAAVVAEHDPGGGRVCDLGDVAVDHRTGTTADDAATFVVGGS